MPRSLITASLFALAASGCGPKEAGGAAASVVKAAASLGDQVPSDAASQAFAKVLAMTPLTDLEVTSSGAVLTYSEMKFSGDGSWSADGSVAIADEEMGCTEGGTWGMDAAESQTSASVNWKVEQTNCAGREAGAEQRAVLTLEGGEVSVIFR